MPQWHNNSMSKSVFQLVRYTQQSAGYHINIFLDYRERSLFAEIFSNKVNNCKWHTAHMATHTVHNFLFNKASDCVRCHLLLIIYISRLITKTQLHCTPYVAIKLISYIDIVFVLLLKYLFLSGHYMQWVVFVIKIIKTTLTTIQETTTIYI